MGHNYWPDLFRVRIEGIWGGVRGGAGGGSSRQWVFRSIQKCFLHVAAINTKWNGSRKRSKDAAPV